MNFHNIFKYRRLQLKPRVNRPGDRFEREADVMADRALQSPGGAELSTPSMTPLQHTSRNVSAEGLAGGGEPLPEETQAQMNQSFGTDFSGVRIHTDSSAARMNHQLSARAFTHGSDIYFNEGQYNPTSPQGQHLLAHELTHVVQQGEMSGEAIMRKVDEASVQTEFEAWADKEQRVKDKNHKDFPWSVWDFLRPQITDMGMQPLPKPKDKAELEKWNDNFAKAEIIAGWLAQLKSTTQSKNVKEDVESKIYYISDALVKAGFVSKGMTHALQTGESERTLVYNEVLKNPSAASAAELETIFTFQIQGQSDPESVDFIDTLCQDDGNALQKLDKDSTKAMFKVMITKYGSHDKVVEAIAATMIFNKVARSAVADDMMSSTLGTPELLFKILSHRYFKDPEYAGAMLLDAPNKDADLDEAKHWKENMPFAFTYKQKYYVKFLTDLATKHSITLKPPTSYAIGDLKAWLDTHTESIGQAAALEYPNDVKGVMEIYKNIADIFFYHVHDKDITPDAEGKLAKRTTGGKPDKSRIEADCDVFATYAMRLFNSAAFEPIGYLGMYPAGEDASRAAHAAVLLRKDGAYYVISSKSPMDAGISEATAGGKKEDAITKMKKLAIDDAYGDPKPKTWEMYYADAEAMGKLPSDFLSKPTKFRRTDLD